MPAGAATSREIHQRLRFEIGQGHARRARQRMLDGHDRHQLFFGQQAVLNALQPLARPDSDKSYVQPPLAHIGSQQFALGHQPADIHRRVLSMKIGQQVDQVQLGQRGDLADGQLPPHFTTGRGNIFGNSPGGLQCWPSALHESFASRRQAHAPRTALEQADAEGLFQPGNLMTQGRLHHMAAFGGSGEAAGVDHRQGILNLLEVHGLIYFQDG
ncbi:hypothetical protein D3C80_954470 [compost metagenome]